MRFLTILLVALAWLQPNAVAAEGIQSKFPTVEEALELAFPKSQIKRHSVFLTEKQKKSAEKLAEAKIDSRLMLVYSVTQTVPGEEPKLVGWGYIDTHKVRAKRETILILINPDNTIKRVEVLGFAEPLEYLPKPVWYGQFVGKRLDKELKIGRGIRSITGATLTATATTSAVRRVLSVHKLVGPPKQTD